MQTTTATTTDTDHHRLDKWLWAARFYRSRTLAQAACTGGKVTVNGARAKAGHTLSVGASVGISQVGAPREVQVLMLVTVRGNARFAQTLYRETPASIEQGLLYAAMQKAAAMLGSAPARKPDKKQRRQLQRLHHMDGQ